MAPNNKPHDSLFKDGFSDRELALDFLRNYLPSRIAEHVNLDTLAITKDTFVDTKWDDYYSDLLYTVTFADGQPGYVYFLFEHKSYHDQFLALQMLRYMLEIWALHLKQNRGTKSLPLIIPISIYHGDTNRSALRVSELVDLPHPDLDIYVPDFEISHYDFSPGIGTGHQRGHHPEAGPILFPGQKFSGKPAPRFRAPQTA